MLGDPLLKRVQCVWCRKMDMTYGNRFNFICSAGCAFKLTPKDKYIKKKC